MSVDDGFGRTELELAGAPNLPAPHDLVGMLRARLEEVVTSARKNRGQVLTPEDTYEIQRGLAGVIEGLTDYARAFQKIAKEAKGYVEDELIDAVGEQDGIPVAGLKVPDTDGTTVVIGRDMANVYSFDHDALFNAVAHTVFAQFEDVARNTEESFIGMMIVAMRQLVALGKFEPQITKVKAFTAELARLGGGPTIASTVTSSIDKKPVYRGVKIEREQPKRQETT